MAYLGSNSVCYPGPVPGSDSYGKESVLESGRKLEEKGHGRGAKENPTFSELHVFPESPEEEGREP